MLVRMRDPSTVGFALRKPGGSKSPLLPNNLRLRSGSKVQQFEGSINAAARSIRSKPAMNLVEGFNRFAPFKG